MLVVSLLGIAALAIAVMPFDVATTGWFGYTPLTTPQVPSLPGSSCAPEVASAWHPKTERVSVRTPNGESVLVLRACRARARHRLTTSAVLLAAGVLAWVFLVRPLRRIRPLPG